MKKIILVFICFYGQMLFSTGFDVCSANKKCSIENDDECLKMAYACGKYYQIVSVLKLETNRMDRIKQYFLGSAYYGLFFQSDLITDKCKYRKKAKSLLKDYLIVVKKTYSVDGDYYERQYTYHAAKTLKVLESFSGCVDDGMTIEDAKSYITEKIVFIMENIFTSDDQKKSGIDISAAKEEMLKQVNFVVSKASEFQTTLSMKLIELKSAERHLENIANVFISDFGAKNGEKSIRSDSSVKDFTQLEKLEQYNEGYKRIDKVINDMKNLIAGDGNWFDKAEGLRRGLLIDIEEVNRKSVESLNQSDYVFPIHTSNSKLLALTDFSESRGHSLLKDSLERLKLSWKSHLETKKPTIYKMAMRVRYLWYLREDNNK